MKQTAPATAADLIPGIRTGIVASGTPGAGERFIQPLVAGQLLDTVTGSGWRLFAVNAALAEQAAARWGEILPGIALSSVEVGTVADGDAVRAWLDARGVSSVLVRPDSYVFGTSTDDTESLVEQLAQRLGRMAPQECVA
jgi:3-(3-hydroxy-phenyl)propionate hydroxylase